ncbi:MAG: MFS transporter [bacterium]
MTENFIRNHRYKFFTVGAIGTFMATLDSSILNVALPTIAGDLNCSINTVAWVVLSYTLTLVSLLLIFGAWTERRGYDFAYRFGYTFFLAGSLLCVLSWSVYSLIAGRIIQAIGTSMFQAVGIGMVAEVFPEGERGKGIGLMVMMVSSGLMAGPPLGGLLLQFFPWQSIFVINLPIGLFGLALTFLYFRLLPRRVSHRKVPLAPGIAISLALFAGIFALSLVSDYGPTDIRVLLIAAVAIAALLIFLRFESNPDRALIGLSLFKNPRFTVALMAAILMFVAMASVMILLPFYLERVRGYEPGEVGMFLVILPLLMFVLAPLAGRLSDKIGFRFLTSFGMATLASGLLLLSGVGVQTGAGYLVLSIVVMGSGVAIFNTPNSSAMMGAVTPQQRAITSGIVSTARNVGMSTGVALGTALFAYWYTQSGDPVADSLAFVASYRQVMYVAVTVSVAGLLFCLGRRK